MKQDQKDLVRFIVWIMVICLLVVWLGPEECRNATSDTWPLF